MSFKRWVSVQYVMSLPWNNWRLKVTVCLSWIAITVSIRQWSLVEFCTVLQLIIVELWNYIRNLIQPRDIILRETSRLKQHLTLSSFTTWGYHCPWDYYIPNIICYDNARLPYTWLWWTKSLYRHRKMWYCRLCTV